MRFAGGLQQTRVVDDKLEREPQKIGGFSAQHHTVEENLEILHDGADVRINRDVEKAKLLLFVNFQRGVHDGVIHAVVNIRCDNRVFAHAGTTHVAFIGEDQRGRDGVYRESGFLIVVTDSQVRVS